MKITPFCSRFLVLCMLSCALIFGLIGLVGGIGPISAAEPQDEAVPQTGELHSTPETTSAIDPDKYAFSNLPAFERDQVSREVNEDSEQTLDTASDMTNSRLMYEFRLKQETIRLYEVILLAIMSLGALAIVLKYMKDSESCHARDMLNGTGLVLVIFSTVLVIIIADVEIQLTAAMGVLGGIAGYLFGTLRSSASPGTDKKKEETTKKQENNL